MNSAELLLSLRQRLYRLGWPLRLAAALLFAALLAQVLLVAPLDEENRQQREQLREAAARRQSLAAGGQGAAPASARALAFAAALGTREAQLEPVARVVQAAQSAGLRLDRGEYRVLREGDARLQRHQLSFPVQASYPALRRWLATALAAEPALALQSISLQRDSSQVAPLESRIVFILYVRAGT